MPAVSVPESRLFDLVLLFASRCLLYILPGSAAISVLGSCARSRHAVTPDTPGRG